MNIINTEFEKSIINEIEKAKRDRDISELKEIVKNLKNNIKGLTIKGYIGDYPTFIEPVYLHPGVKIGDTVLIGPNVIIGKNCELGAFSELTNVILGDNVVIPKYSKLNMCIIESDIILPEKFIGTNCFIFIDDNKEIQKLNF
ncbi:MAG: hypothetical protein ACTSQJ_16185 [Promethearchaeota archaeon]